MRFGVGWRMVNLENKFKIVLKVLWGSEIFIIDIEKIGEIMFFMVNVILFMYSFGGKMMMVG